MPKSLTYSYLTVLLAAQLSWTNALCAYEQGSYYIFDLVESDTTEPIMGRLSVAAGAINAEEIEAATTLLETSSEFEIDINQTMQTTTNSSFEVESVLEETAETENVSFSTDSFDFETSTTVFGD